VLKIVENLWAVGALPRTLLWELTVLPDPRPPSWWEGGLLPPPQESHPRSWPSASIFGSTVMAPDDKSWAGPWYIMWSVDSSNILLTDSRHVWIMYNGINAIAATT